MNHLEISAAVTAIQKLMHEIGFSDHPYVLARFNTESNHLDIMATNTGPEVVAMIYSLGLNNLLDGGGEFSELAETEDTLPARMARENWLRVTKDQQKGGSSDG